LNKVGIRSSLEEAMALKASIGSGDLTLEKFEKLVFSKDESMKMNLSEIAAPTQD